MQRLCLKMMMKRRETITRSNNVCDDHIVFISAEVDVPPQELVLAGIFSRLCFENGVSNRVANFVGRSIMNFQGASTHSFDLQ